MISNRPNIYLNKKNEEKTEYDMYIYDDITKYGEFDWFTWDYSESETSANYFRDRLQEIPADAKINLYINSDGGDVYEATAIYNNLRRHAGEVVGYVDGRAHSAAFLVLQACDKRVMGKGTTAIVHNMWTVLAGNAAEFRKAADDLDKMMEANRQILLERAHDLTEEHLIELMDAETVLTPDDALSYGLIDEISSIEKTEEKTAEESEIENLKAENEALKQKIQAGFKATVIDEFKQFSPARKATKNNDFNDFFKKA